MSPPEKVDSLLVCARIFQMGCGLISKDFEKHEREDGENGKTTAVQRRQPVEIMILPSENLDALLPPLFTPPNERFAPPVYAPQC